MLSRFNNLRHQQGDMYIAATVSLVRIHGKITKSAKCIEKSICAQNMPILVLSSNTNAFSVHIWINVDTSTNYP